MGFKKLLGASPVTSVTGIGVMLGAIATLINIVAGALVVLTDGDPETVVNLETLWPQIVAAWTAIWAATGLMKARDNTTSSEQVARSLKE